MALRSYLEDTLSLLQDNLSKQTAVRVTKELRSLNIEFNYKGNQQQFQFNLEQKEKLEEALELITSSAVKSLVKEVIQEIEKRNKLIRLADRSEVGWKAVEEYTAIADASDSGDDRRMRQAEQRAIRKKEAKKRHSSAYNTLTTGPVQRHYYDPQRGQNFRSYRENSYGLKTGFQQYQNPQRFACHICGQSGHWKAPCPQRQGFIQPFNPFIQPTQPFQSEEGQRSLPKVKKP